MDLNQINNNYQNGFVDVNKDRVKQTGESLSLQLDKIKKLQPGEELEVLIPNPKNSNEYFSVKIVCNKQQGDYSVKNSYGIDHVQGNGERPLQVHQGKGVSGAIGVSSQGVPGKDNVLYMWSYVDGEVEQLKDDGTYQKAYWSVVSGSTYENWVNSSDFVADMEKMLTEGKYLGQSFQFPSGKVFQPLSKDNIQEFISELKGYSQSIKFESGQVYGRGSSVRSMTNAPDLFKWSKARDGGYRLEGPTQKQGEDNFIHNKVEGIGVTVKTAREDWYTPNHELSVVQKKDLYDVSSGVAEDGNFYINVGNNKSIKIETNFLEEVVNFRKEPFSKAITVIEGSSFSNTVNTAIGSGQKVSLAYDQISVEIGGQERLLKNVPAATVLYMIGSGMIILSEGENFFSRESTKISDNNSQVYLQQALDATRKEPTRITADNQFKDISADRQEREKLIAGLKQKGYLDQQGMVTDKFYDIKSYQDPQFVADLKSISGRYDFSGSKEKIFDVLLGSKGGEINIHDSIQKMIDSGQYQKAAHLLLLLTKPSNNCSGTPDNPVAFFAGVRHADGKVSLYQADRDGTALDVSQGKFIKIE